MGACTSKHQIVRTVASPQRSPTTKSRAPTSPARFPPDVRLATDADLPNKAKVDERRPFFPDEAATPEVLSARSSTDDENGVADGDDRASAQCQSSKESAPIKSAQTIMQPGSFPDTFHDASDVFENSPNFRLLNSENNPFQEKDSETDKIQPLISTSFTSTETVEEMSIKKSKEEPPQAAVTLQQISYISSAEETNSEAAECDHLIQQEGGNSASASTLHVKHSDISSEKNHKLLVTGTTSAAQYTPSRLPEMQTEKDFLTVTTSNQADKESEEQSPMKGMPCEEGEVSEHSHANVNDPRLLEKNQEGQARFPAQCMVEEEEITALHQKDTSSILGAQTKINRKYEKSMKEKQTEVETKFIPERTVEGNKEAAGNVTEEEIAESMNPEIRTFEAPMPPNNTEMDTQHAAWLEKQAYIPSTEEMRPQLTTKDTKNMNLLPETWKQDVRTAQTLADEVNINKQSDKQYLELCYDQPESEKKENAEAKSMMGRHANTEVPVDNEVTLIPANVDVELDKTSSKDKKMQSQYISKAVDLVTNENEKDKEIPTNGKGPINRATSELEMSAYKNEIGETVLIGGNEETLAVNDDEIGASNRVTEETEAYDQKPKKGPTSELEVQTALVTNMETQELYNVINAESEQSHSTYEQQKGSESSLLIESLKPAEGISSASTTSIEQESMLESNTMTEQESRMLTGKEMLLQEKERGLAKPESTMHNSNKEDPKIYELSSDSVTSETLVKTGNVKMVDQPALTEEKLKETDADPSTCKDAKTDEQTASVEEGQQGTEIAAAIVAATAEIILANKDSGKTVDRSASSFGDQHKELERELAIHAITETDQTLTTIGIAQTGPTEAVKKDSQSEQSSFNKKASRSLELQIAQQATSLDNGACRETKDNSQAAVAEIEPNLQKQDVHDDQSKENKKEKASVITKQAPDVEKMVDSKDVHETEGDNSQAATPDSRLELQCQDQEKQIQKQEPPKNNSEKMADSKDIHETEGDNSQAATPDFGLELQNQDQEEQIPKREPPAKIEKTVDSKDVHQTEQGNSQAATPDSGLELQGQDQVKQIQKQDPPTNNSEKLDLNINVLSTSSEINKTLVRGNDTNAADQTTSIEIQQEESDIEAPSPGEEPQQAEILTTREYVKTVEQTASIKEHPEESDAAGPASNKKAEPTQTLDTRKDVQNVEQPVSTGENHRVLETIPTTNVATEIVELLASWNDAAKAETDPVINVAIETAETHVTRDNAKVADTMALIKEQHGESDMDATTKAGTKIIENLATKNDAQTAEPAAPKEERLEEPDVAPATNATTGSSETLTTRDKAQISNTTVPSQEQQKESDTITATYATTEVSVPPIHATKENINAADLESNNVENAKEQKCIDSDNQQSVSSPALEEQCEKSHTAPVSDAASATIDNLPRGVNAHIADPTAPKSELKSEVHKESDTLPATHATIGMDDVLANTLTKAVNLVGLESSNNENVEEPESPFVDQRQTILSPSLDGRHENSGAAPVTNATEEQQEGSNTAPVTDATIEPYVAPMDAVANDAQDGKLESSNNENVKEQESTFIDQQWAVLSLGLKDQQEEAEIAETLATRNDAQIPNPTVPAEEQHEESGTTSTIEADVEPVKVVTENVEAAELESSNPENIQKPESADVDQKQSASFPALENQCKELDTAAATNAATEITETLPTGNNAQIAELVQPREGQHEDSDATPVTNAIEVDDVPTGIGAADVKVVQLESRNAENVEQPKSAESDLEQTALLSALEKQHEDMDATPVTNAITEADDVPIGPVTEDVKVVGLERSNAENVEEPESTDGDQQQKVSLPALEERLKETNMPPATSAATEIAETLPTRENAQIVDLIRPTEEWYENSYSNEVTNATTETDIDAITQDAQAVELQSNNLEDVKDPQSADIDQKQTVHSLTLEEKCEDSETAQDINAAKEVVEILPKRDDVERVDPKVPTEERQEESDTTPTTDTRTKADGVPYNAVTQDVKVVEGENNNAENAEEPKDTENDQQQTISTPVFDEQHKRTDTIPASLATTETDVPIDPTAKNVESVELEISNTKTVEEPESTDETLVTGDNGKVADTVALIKEQCGESEMDATINAGTKIIENLAIKNDAQTEEPATPKDELLEESDVAPATNATTGSSETLSARDNAQISNTTVPSQEQQRESDTITATYAATEVSVPTIHAAKENTNAADHESSNVKNAKEPKCTDSDNQQSVSSPALEEKCEKTHRAQAFDATSASIDTLPRRVNAHVADPTAPKSELKSEVHKESDTLPATHATIDMYDVLTNELTKAVNLVGLESSNNENVEEPESPFVDQWQTILYPSLDEQHEKSGAAPATKATEEQQEGSNAAPVTDATTEPYVAPMDAVAKDSQAGKLESNNTENVEEQESTFMDQQWAVLSLGLKDQQEEAEFAETIATGDDAQIPKPTVPAEEQHEESGTASTIEADVVPIKVTTENLKAAELESRNPENIEKTEIADVDQKQSASFPALEEQYKELDTAAATEITETLPTGDDAQIAEGVQPIAGQHEDTNATPVTNAVEVDDVPTGTVTADVKVVQLESSNAENVEQPKRAESDLEQTALSPTSEKQHENMDATPVTNAITEADDVLIGTGTEVVKVVRLERSKAENVEEPESKDGDQQQKVSLPALEEQLKETNLDLATSTATEIAETLPTRDNAQMVDPIRPTEEWYEDSYSNQVTNAPTETDIDAITEEAQVLELQSNNSEDVKDPQSADIDQKQSVPYLAFEEKCEESETAQDINAAKEVVEILPTRNDVETVAPKVQTEEQQEQSDTTPTTDTRTKADGLPYNAVTKDEKFVEGENNNAENAEEPKGTEHDQLQTLSAPVFDEQHEKTDTIPASLATTETDVAIDATTKNVKSVELEISNAKTVEEPESVDETLVTRDNGKVADTMALIKEQNGESEMDATTKAGTKIIENLATKNDAQTAEPAAPKEERLEESDVAPATNATTGSSETLTTRDNAQISNTTVPSQEQQKESDTITATYATTEVSIPPIHAAKENINGADLESNNVENAKEPKCTDSDNQQSVSSPALEEQCEKSHTAPVSDAASATIDTLPRGVNAHIADPTAPKSELKSEVHKESDTLPATHATIGMDDVLANTLTKAVNLVGLESSNDENVEEPESPLVDQWQTILSPSLDGRHEKSGAAPVTNATEEQQEGSNTSPVTDATIEPYVPPMDAVANDAQDGKLESSNNENVEEQESTFMDQEWAVLSLGLKDQQEEAEIAETLATRNDAQIPNPTVPAEEQHEESGTTSTIEADVAPVKVITENVEAAEREGSNPENIEKPESADIDQKQLTSFPALEEQCKELDTAAATNAATEITETLPTRGNAQIAELVQPIGQHEDSATPVTNAIEVDDVPTGTVTADVKVAQLESSNAENVEQPKSADSNLEQTALSLALEKQHEDMDATPVTDAITEADDVPIGTVREDVKVVGLERSNEENVEEPEGTDGDHQQKVSLPALEERLKETNMALVTSAATEIAETLPRRDNAKMVDPIRPTEQRYEDSYLNQVANPTTETDTDAKSDDAQVVELQSNNLEDVKDAGNADIDQKQTVASLTLVEKFEESETAQGIDAAKEVVEILPTQKDVHTVDQKVPTDEQQEESDTTPTTDTRTEAYGVPSKAATQDVKVVDGENNNAENAEEPKSTENDQQQTVSSPVFGEGHEKTDTIPASLAATEADVPIDPTTKNVKCMELEISNAKTVEEPESADFGQHQTISSPNLEQQHEKSDTGPTTSATREIAKTFCTGDNVVMADPTVPKEEQHEKLDTTPATDATTGTDNIAVGTVIQEAQVVELKTGNAENVERPNSADADSKQSAPSPTLEEQGEESGRNPVINAAAEIANTLPTRSNQQRADPTLSTTEQYEESDRVPVPDPTTEADTMPFRMVTENVKVVEHESSHTENVQEPENADIDQKEAVSSPVLGLQDEESARVPLTHATTKTAEILPSMDNAQKAETTLPIEHHGESDATPATDAIKAGDAVTINAVTEVAKLVEHESGNAGNVEEPASADNNQQQMVLFQVLKEQCEKSHTSPAIDAVTGMAEILPIRNDAQIADPTVSTGLTEESILHEVTNAATEASIDAAPEGTQLKELQSNNSANVEGTESADVEQKQSVSSSALQEKHEESETTQTTNVEKEIVEILPTRNEAQMIANPTMPTEEQQEASDTTPTADATTEVDGIPYNAVTQDVNVVAHESSNAENAEEPRSPNLGQQQSISSPGLKEHHGKSDTTPSANAAMKIEAPIDPITDDIKVVELESSDAEKVEEPESADAGQHQTISSTNLEEQHEESDTTPTTSATREIVNTLSTSDNVQMADPIVQREEQLGELGKTLATGATTAIDSVATDMVIQEAQVVEIKTGNAGNIEGADSADSDKKQLVLSPTLEEQDEGSSVDPAINAATEIANILPIRDDQSRADLTVSTTGQSEEPSTIPAPDVTMAADVAPVNTISEVTEDVKIVQHESGNTGTVREHDIDQLQVISSQALELQDKESVTVPATHATIKIAQTLPTMDNAQRAEPTVPIEEHHEESDATPATDATTEGDMAINVVTEVAKLAEHESGNAENIEEPESADNNQQQTVLFQAFKEQYEKSHASPAEDAVTEIAEMLPIRNDAQIADPTVSTGLTEESISNEVTNATTDASIDGLPEDTQLMELQTDNSENVEDTESADIKQRQSVSSPALQEKHEESETTQATNVEKEIVEILPTRNDAQMIANPTVPTEEQQEASDTTLSTDATTEADGISYNAVTRDVNVVAHESSNVKNAEEPISQNLGQQQTISSPVLKEHHQKSDTTSSDDATMKTEVPIDPITEDIKVVELESSNAEKVEEPESADVGQHQTISSTNLEEQHDESDTTPTTSATREIVNTLSTSNNVQMADSTVPREEQHKELDRSPATGATTATNSVVMDTVIQEAQVIELKTSNAGNIGAPGSADTDKKQLALSPTLEEQGEESGTDPANNAPTEIATTLPTRDDQWMADPTVSTTDQCEEASTIPAQYEEASTIPAPDVTTAADVVPVNTVSVVTQNVKIVQHESGNTYIVRDLDIDQLQDEESVTVPATHATTKTDQIFPTMGNAPQRAEPTVPPEEHHEESHITPATEATTEGDAVAIDVVTEVPKVVELESIEAPQSAEFNQQTVSSQVLEEQHKESHTTPAANAEIEIAEMLPMQNDAQVADPMASTDTVHEESNSKQVISTTKEADIDAVIIDAQLVESESNNSENIKERESAGLDQKHSVSSPALEDKYEESETGQATNTTEEIIEILPTKNDAQLAGPTVPIEERQDATTKADVVTYHAVAQDVKVVEIESRNVENAERSKITAIDQQQTVFLPVFREKASDTTPATDTTDIDVLAISTITEDVNVVELQSSHAGNVEESHSTDPDHQPVVFSAGLKKQGGSDADSVVNASQEFAEILPTKDNAKEVEPAIATELLRKQTDTTVANNAPIDIDVDVLAVNPETKDMKLVGIKSSNVENRWDPERTDNEKQVISSPPLDECRKGTELEEHKKYEASGKVTLKEENAVVELQHHVIKGADAEDNAIGVLEAMDHNIANGQKEGIAEQKTEEVDCSTAKTLD